MNSALGHEFRYLAPVWLATSLLPWPVLLLWRTDDGSRAALGLFFVGSAALVAYSFKREAGAADGTARRRRTWRVRLGVVSAALLVSWLALSAALSVNDRGDFVFVFLALAALVPSCTVVPYLTLLTQKPFAAVVFTVFLVGSMKLLGCVVVVLLRGWDAGAGGHLTMPWTRPNLLVWLFWANTALLSLGCYCLGVRRFCDSATDAADPSAAPDPAT
jgi:hypothetical protein